MEKTERQGPGRRADDCGGHCDEHAKRGDDIADNTAEIAAGKESRKTLIWVAGFALTVAMSITGYVMNQTNRAIDNVGNSVNEVKTLVQNNAIEAREFKVQIQNLQLDVNELKQVNPRVRLLPR